MQLSRLILLLPMLAACGGATLVLKSPVEDQCTKAGIQGCPEVVAGVLTYIDGDKPKGKDQMTRGAAQNAPEKVKAFAQAVRSLPLDKIPGAQKYTSVVREVADVLAGAPGAPGSPGGGGADAPAGPGVAGQAPPGRGYELFFNGRRVSGPDAQFYTREQAMRNCTAMSLQHPELRVSCAFEGAFFVGTP
jgi:hypothetical protein